MQVSDMTTDKSQDSELELERPCPCCEGTGGGLAWECDKCNGAGMLPTEAGKRILALVRRNVTVRELASNG